MSKFLLFEENYEEGIKKINTAISFFKEIDDTVYLTRSLILLSKMERLNKNKESASPAQSGFL